MVGVSDRQTRMDGVCDDDDWLGMKDMVVVGRRVKDRMNVCMGRVAIGVTSHASIKAAILLTV